MKNKTLADRFTRQAGRYTRYTRRRFLRIAGGSSAIALAGGATWLAGCDSTGVKLEETPFRLMTNPTDPLLVSTVAASGEMVSFYGGRSADGVPTSMDHVVVASGSAEHRYDIAADGLPTRVRASNGVEFHLDWIEAGKCVLTVVGATREYQLNTLVDFASIPGPTISQFANSVRSSQDSRLDRPSSLTVAPHTEVRDRVRKSAANVGVSVYRCGSLDSSSLNVNVLAHSIDGGFLMSVPATRVGDGTYRASIPSNITPTYNPHDICLSLEGLLGKTCLALDGLGPQAVHTICASLAVALDVITIPSGEAALMIAACNAAIPAWQTYCSTLNYSNSGSPSLADFLCRGVFEDRTIKTDVVLTAEVVALPNNVKSQSVTSPPDGPFPTLSIDLGGQAEIRSLTPAPSNPAGGEDYVATSQVFCLPAGSRVTMRVSGTDGYADSQTTAVTDAQVNADFSLIVPGGASGVRDQITVTVILPLGNVLTRTASLVFGG